MSGAGVQTPPIAGLGVGLADGVVVAAADEGLGADAATVADGVGAEEPHAAREAQRRPASTRWLSRMLGITRTIH